MFLIMLAKSRSFFNNAADRVVDAFVDAWTIASSSRVFAASSPLRPTSWRILERSVVLDNMNRAYALYWNTR